MKKIGLEKVSYLKDKNWKNFLVKDKQKIKDFIVNFHLFQMKWVFQFQR